MDRAPRVRVRFGRRTVEAAAGEPLLAALGRGGWPSLVRSVRYHRPRGPMCGVGDCTGCLVRVNGVPNRRACTWPVENGDVVRSENSWPSVRFDALGAIDLLLPHGLDTVHGLRRPQLFRRAYQRAVRRLAGFGDPPDLSAARPMAPPRVVAHDVAIVGAGRAGTAVAAELSRVGRRSILLERRRELADPAIPGAEFLGGTPVTIASTPGGPSASERFTLVGVSADGRGVVVRAADLVVATGGYDAALLFEGSDRPGVVTADLALSGLGLPLGRVVVVGGGTRSRQVVERRADEVEAVVAFGEVSPALARAAAENGVALYPRTRVVRSVGRARLRGIELARRGDGGRFRLGCSTLVLAHRRLPSAQLAFQVGATRVWLDPPGAYYPVADGSGRTAVPGLYVVGSAAAPTEDAGPCPAAVASAIAGEPSRDGTAGRPPPDGPVRGSGELAAYYRELLREPRRGKWVVCPCEDVLLDELEDASARGYRGLEVIKRYTGTGTGLCQGRYCLPEAIVLLSLLEGRGPTEVGYITQRPPLTPTPLGALASVAGEFDRREVP